MVSLNIALKVFILKIKSRCNINCSYCYEYNLADKSWRNKPSTISEETLEKSVLRISEYVKKHSLQQIVVVFHGGEPMLAPKNLFIKTVELFKHYLNNECKVVFSCQTNGTLIDNSWLDLFQALNINIGISIDGTKEANDKYRVDFKGRSTFSDVLKSINLLRQEEYQAVNSSVLTVIDPSNDPIETYNFFKSLNIKAVDFLFPLYNYENVPPFKNRSIGEWLCKIFDIWWANNDTIRVRLFEDIIHLMLGGFYSVENLGLSPVELIVIQTDGSYEAVDSLKSTFDGAVITGKNVFTNNFDEVLDHPLISSRLDRSNNLCSICSNCRLVKVCGGGYIPHRYDSVNNFNNPSIFCQDLIMIIERIEKALRMENKDYNRYINSVLSP